MSAKKLYSLLFQPPALSDTCLSPWLQPCASVAKTSLLFLGPYDPNWLQNYKIRTPLVNPFNISYPFLALFLSFVALPPSLLPSSPLPLLAL